MYNETNFFENTEAIWQMLEAGPQRKPDYVSLKKRTFTEAMQWLLAVNGRKMPGPIVVLENPPVITDAHKAVTVGDFVHFAVPDEDSYEDDPCRPWEKIGVVLNVGELADVDGDKYFGAECQAASSAYWYNEQGVYRLSNYWGKIKTCRWHKSHYTAGGYEFGFCRWQDFEQVGSQSVNELLEKFNQTRTSRKA